MRTGGAISLFVPLVCLGQVDAFITSTATTMAAKGFGSGGKATAKTKVPSKGGGECAK